jgi:hypothetical protein
MRQEPTTARRVMRSAGLSALGFGLGLALTGLILGALTYQIHDFNTGRLLGSLAYACAGALGGAALAWVDVSKRRAPLLALAGAVGLSLGYYVTDTIVSVWVDVPASPVQGFLAWQVVLTIQYAAIGAFTGALLGLAQRDRRRTVGLVLAGLLGFGLLYLSSNLFFMVGHVDTLVPGMSGEIWHDGIVMGIGEGLWGAVGGAISGACLGVANAWRPHGPTGISGAAGAGV